MIEIANLILELTKKIFCLPYEAVKSVVGYIKNVSKKRGETMSPVDKLLQKAIDHYGKDNQVKKSIEEMAELTKALCKGDVENIKEEIADVQIMLYQLQMIFYNGNELSEYATRKLLRLENRMETDK